LEYLLVVNPMLFDLIESSEEGAHFLWLLLLCFGEVGVELLRWVEWCVLDGLRLCLTHVSGLVGCILNLLCGVTSIKSDLILKFTDFEVTFLDFNVLF